MEWQLFRLQRWSSCQATDCTDVECTVWMLTMLPLPDRLWRLEHLLLTECIFTGTEAWFSSERVDDTNSSDFFCDFYCCCLWKMVNLRHSSAPTGNTVDSQSVLANVQLSDTWAICIFMQKIFCLSKWIFKSINLLTHAWYGFEVNCTKIFTLFLILFY